MMTMTTMGIIWMTTRAARTLSKEGGGGQMNSYGFIFLFCFFHGPQEAELYYGNKRVAYFCYKKDCDPPKFVEISNNNKTKLRSLQ